MVPVIPHNQEVEIEEAVSEASEGKIIRPI
jgi:hypothetical protein